MNPKHRALLRAALCLAAITALTSCGSDETARPAVSAADSSPAASAPAEPSAMSEPQFPVKKTDAEWRAQLTDMQYHVTREKGTERAFTGEYWDHKADGVYVCVACDQPLYDSTTKYNSGCGWPSYWKAIGDDAITESQDRSFYMIRTELMCSRCGAHLGHVFNDGPPPTGMRHCINSASLKFVPRDQLKPTDKVVEPTQKPAE